MKRSILFILLLSVLLAGLFLANLLYGSADIPFDAVWAVLTGDDTVRESWRFIIMNSRLPQALTALLAGGSLAVSGMMLQTAFRNPLADPSVFGISSGAALGAAVVILLMGGGLSATVFSFSGMAAVLVAALAGAMGITAVIFFFSLFVRSNVMLLIIGIMIGYLSSSVISLLNFFATQDGVKSYVIWGMGNFGDVSLGTMPVFAALLLAGLTASVFLIKPLDALLLGDRYAENLGYNIPMIRNSLLVITGVLTAVVTSFCGPVSFIGLAVPHIARMIMHTDRHIVLMPFTILTGAAVAMLCNLVSVMPSGNGIIPLNAITPIIGAPVVIYVILRKR
ncbi:iron chelate uptake ABC transporter family permease subunit [Xylanibacter muris]|uniref:Iron ABC transporter permease n=1 Tax=Xylanibacter muris TaxID=2736290 RepID=A0ABX2ANN1_9BACT|nr:iron ABC transporter permease [Xylanibacter muris]